MTQSSEGARDVRPRMLLVAALETLRDVRTDQVVISSMGSAREWPKLSSHPLDLHFVPSAMGGAAPLGLGIALAQPNREVIVLSGDGSLLMNLGSLATIIAAGATNLTLVVLENQVYEVTGGQITPGAVAGVDFTMVAQGCGWNHVYEYDELKAWQANVSRVITSPGPRLVVLHVEPVREDFHVSAPSPIQPRVEQLRAALLGSA